MSAAAAVAVQARAGGSRCEALLVYSRRVIFTNKIIYITGRFGPLHSCIYAYFCPLRLNYLYRMIVIDF